MMRFKPLFGRPQQTAQQQDNAIRYNDAAEGIDLQYTAPSVPDIKEDIILMNPVEAEFLRLTGADSG